MLGIVWQRERALEQELIHGRRPGKRRVRRPEVRRGRVPGGVFLEAAAVRRHRAEAGEVLPTFDRVPDDSDVREGDPPAVRGVPRPPDGAVEKEFTRERAVAQYTHAPCARVDHPNARRGRTRPVGAWPDPVVDDLPVLARKRPEAEPAATPSTPTTTTEPRLRAARLQPGKPHARTADTTAATLAELRVGFGLRTPSPRIGRSDCATPARRSTSEVSRAAHPWSARVVRRRSP